MHVKCIMFLVFLLLGTCLHFSWARLTKADTGVIRVPNDFPTIQEAINAAENGSTILVNSGVYNEHVVINKTLTLLGASKEDTIIDGSRSGDVVTITADNVLVNGFTVRNSSLGPSGGVGVLLYHSTGSIVRGNIVTQNGWAGIELDGSNSNTISDNVVSFNVGSSVGLIWGDGIMFSSSNNNTVNGNVITYSVEDGIRLDSSDNNSIFGNVIEHNMGGVNMAAPSSGNVVFRNAFIRNTIQGWAELENNTWSASEQGNYWADYDGLDDGSGGRVAGDGVGDTGLPWFGVDYYPLINPVNPFLIFWDNMAFPVSLISNSTVYDDGSSAFGFNQAAKTFTFELVGPANATGYMNITIPKILLSGPWNVRIDGNPIRNVIQAENQTHTTIYVSYPNNVHYVQIDGTNVIPEYPISSIVLLVTLLILPPMMLIAKKKRNKPSITKPELSRTDA